jgi:hypothetical protein
MPAVEGCVDEREYVGWQWVVYSGLLEAIFIDGSGVGACSRGKGEW